MDVTRAKTNVSTTAPSATFDLDEGATPAQFHEFLRSQPGTSHVTLEFKGGQGSAQQKPVVRVVHIGEREVLDQISRRALINKLQAWNDPLLGHPAAKDAALLLNPMLEKADLSIDVKDIAPALGKMSEAYRACQANILVKAWLADLEKAEEKMGMDVTQAGTDVLPTAYSATFDLDEGATPAQFHEFLRSQPGASHVTLEFKGGQGSAQQKPVVRVVHIGEREVLDQISRRALINKLQAWNDPLLGHPAAKDAALLLNPMLEKAELSIDVKDIAPAMSKMSEAYRASQVNIHVKAWLENKEKVKEIVVSKKDHIPPEMQKEALDFACTLLRKFSNLEDIGFNPEDLMKEAWGFGKELNPRQHSLIENAVRLLSLKKENADLQRIIGPEVLPLLLLCRDARRTEFKDFSIDLWNRAQIEKVKKALREPSAGRGMVQQPTRNAPDSPRNMPTTTAPGGWTSYAGMSATLSSSPGASEDAGEKRKGHRRAGSGMTSLTQTAAPAPGRREQPAIDEQGRGESHTSRVPKSPRYKNSVEKSDRSGILPSAAQTMKEKRAEKVRTEIRRAQTDLPRDEPVHARQVSKSQEAAQPYSTSRADDEAAGSKASTNDLRPSSTSGRKRSLKKSETVTAGSAGHGSHASASPQRVRRRRIPESEAMTTATASTASTPSSTTTSSEGKRKKRVPGSRKQDRRSQPAVMDMSALFDSAKWTDADGTARASTASTGPVTAPANEGQPQKRVPRSRMFDRHSQPTSMQLQELFKSPQFTKAREESDKAPVQRSAAED